jgi:predicted ATP-binding protein involved in virulence
LYAQNPDPDILVDWLFRAYAGTREIHDVSPPSDPKDLFARRCLVAVNDSVRAQRLLKRESSHYHLWVLPPGLWGEARAGRIVLPDGFGSEPVRSWQRMSAHDAITCVEHLVLANFRGFEQTRVSFNTGMNVLIGQNGAGKTSVLDALATGLAGVIRPLNPSLGGTFSGSSLPLPDVRKARIDKGGTTTFEPQFPAQIDVHMQLFGEPRRAGVRAQQSEMGAVFTGANQPISFVDLTDVVREAVQDGFDVTLPLVAYYGAGRTWRGEQERPASRDDLSRLSGYEGCLSPSTRLSGMRAWFRRMELLALQDGRTPAVLEASKRAIVATLEGFDLVRYDARIDDLAARSSVTGLLLGFEQLSDGQRNMLGMVADMAYRAATLNPHLGENAALETPGVVLIDELDLHLHPRWQRRVVTDLKAAFPRIQFICTSHSPQIVGEVRRDAVCLLGPKGITHPPVALGADSNWILDHVMEGARSETASARRLQDEAEDALAEGDLPAAKSKLSELRRLLDGETGELVRLESTLGSLEALARDPEE